MPYFLLRLFEPSGSMRKILPNADARFCDRSQRIAAAAAVGHAHVEQAELGAARLRERIERELTGIVVRERLPQPHQLARRSAVVGGGARRLRRPLEQDGVVRGASAARA